MAYVKTKNHPAAAPHGYEWPDGETVVEVADEHASELLRIPGGGFYESLPGDDDYPVEPQADEAHEAATTEPAAVRTPVAEPDPDLYEPPAVVEEDPADPVGQRRTRQRNRP